MRTGRRAAAALVVALAAVPLVYPPIPPLVDLFGHMGRYRVQLDIGRSPWLHLYYGFHWAAIGNLGVDLLVMPLGRLIGLEPAVKLIVMAIPPLTVFGFLWVAREVHGRVPPTALFALPLPFDGAAVRAAAQGAGVDLVRLDADLIARAEPSST